MSTLVLLVTWLPVSLMVAGIVYRHKKRVQVAHRLDQVALAVVVALAGGYLVAAWWTGDGWGSVAAWGIVAALLYASIRMKLWLRRRGAS